MKLAKNLLLFFMCFAVNSFCFAEEIFLKNNDRITGKIIGQNNEAVVVETEALGILTIKKEFLKEDVLQIKEEQPLSPDGLVQDKGPKVWKREFSLGYNLSKGNTEKSQLMVSFLANRRTQDNELTLKAQGFYASTDEKMNVKRYGGMARYAYSFGAQLKWYQFYKLELDHDRFSNIDYRIIPSTGVGHWFFDTEDFKLMAEVGAGFEHVHYRDPDERTNKGIVVPRIFFEKSLIGQSKISNDVSLYLPVEEPSSYRLRGESSFINPIDDRWSFRLSLIDDFNNRPGPNIKKNDLYLLSSVGYSF